MDLNFSEEQVLLRDMVRNLCEEHSTTRVVRDTGERPGRRSRRPVGRR
jgi:hypothetical protein